MLFLRLLLIKRELSAVEGASEAFVVFHIQRGAFHSVGELLFGNQAVLIVTTLEEFRHGADDTQGVTVIIHSDIHQRGGQIHDGGRIKDRILQNVR